MLKNKINCVVTWIHNSMPVSKRLFVRQNMAMVVVLESHKEFQMLNRQDIMMLAKQSVAKQMAVTKEQSTVPTSPNNEDVMYG